MDKSSADSPHKFLTLDALRGVAAVVVVAFHLCAPGTIPHGHLAVDFFFLLSGFVLALAYQDRLDGGWSTPSFLKVRLIRLYPLYVLGVGLGLAIAMRLASFGSIHQSRRTYVILAGLAILMLPNIAYPHINAGSAYPLDFPTWSLTIEIFANLFHGVVLRRRSDRFLAVIVMIAGLLFLASVKLTGMTDFGADTRYLALAIPRVLFSYAFGILLFRIWKRGKLRFRIPFLLSPVLLVVTLVTPWFRQQTTGYDLMVMFCFFPLLLLASASSRPPALLTKASRLLGRTSYAIYVLHIPIRGFLRMFLHFLSRHKIAISPAQTWIVDLLGAIAIALLADHFYDEPVRAYLRTRFIKPKRVKSLPATPLSM